MENNAVIEIWTASARRLKTQMTYGKINLKAGSFLWEMTGI